MRDTSVPPYTVPSREIPRRPINRLIGTLFLRIRGLNTCLSIGNGIWNKSANRRTTHCFFFPPLISQPCYLSIVLVWKSFAPPSHLEFITQSAPCRISILVTTIPETERLPTAWNNFYRRRGRFEYSPIDLFGSSVRLNIQWFRSFVYSFDRSLGTLFQSNLSNRSYVCTIKTFVIVRRNVRVAKTNLLLLLFSRRRWPAV